MLMWISSTFYSWNFIFQDVFYSRKNFKRPDLQKNPHRSFEKEVAFLDSFFNNGKLELNCYMSYLHSALKHLWCKILYFAVLIFFNYITLFVVIYYRY